MATSGRCRVAESSRERRPGANGPGPPSTIRRDCRRRRRIGFPTCPGSHPARHLLEPWRPKARAWSGFLRGRVRGNRAQRGSRPRAGRVPQSRARLREMQAAFPSETFCGLDQACVRAGGRGGDRNRSRANLRRPPRQLEGEVGDAVRADRELPGRHRIQRAAGSPGKPFPRQASIPPCSAVARDP